MTDSVFNRVFGVKVARKYTGRLICPSRGKRGYFVLPRANKLPKRMTAPNKGCLECILESSDLADDRYAQRVEIKYISKKVGYGVFAREDIPRGIVGLYAGELKKLNRFSTSRYLFSFITPLLREVMIDGSRRGNWAAFINHSPLGSKVNNLIVKEYFYKGLPYILFYAPKKIKKGAQLLYDYGDSYWESLELAPEKL